MRRVILVAAVTTALAARAGAQAIPKTMEEMHKLHQDPKAYIAMLEDPARDAYQKPHEVMMALALREGERLAALGGKRAEHRAHAVRVRPLDGARVVERHRNATVSSAESTHASPDPRATGHVRSSAVPW